MNKEGVKKALVMIIEEIVLDPGNEVIDWVN
jgi:hypothetical protein